MEQTSFLTIKYIGGGCQKHQIFSEQKNVKRKFVFLMGSHLSQESALEEESRANSRGAVSVYF